jgi:hypothetical protein
VSPYSVEVYNLAPLLYRDTPVDPNATPLSIAFLWALVKMRVLCDGTFTEINVYFVLIISFTTSVIYLCSFKNADSMADYFCPL